MLFVSVGGLAYGAKVTVTQMVIMTQQIEEAKQTAQIALTNYYELKDKVKEYKDSVQKYKGNVNAKVEEMKGSQAYQSLMEKASRLQAESFTKSTDEL